MKCGYIFTSLLAFLLIHSPAGANDFSFNRLEGFYYNPNYGTQIAVRQDRHKVKVRGLDRRLNKWRTFRQDGRNRWTDRNGNALRLGRRGQLILQELISSRRRGVCETRVTTFYKERPRNQYGRNGRNERYDGSYQDRRFQNNTERDRNRDRRYGLNDSYNGFRSLQGYWYSRDFQKSMQVELTSNGLRTRLEDDRNWTTYRIKGNRYIDSKGNTLEMDQSGVLYWKSFNGLRTIVLTKDRP